VGVVVGKGLLLGFEIEPALALPDEKEPAWPEGDIFDFLERMFSQVLGILSLEEVLFCEHQDGVDASDMFAEVNNDN
jgi:hypothetical protein